MFKDIPGFPNYMINEVGEVYSEISNKILKPSIDAQGYARVCLRKNNKQYNSKIHRLVALTFIPNPDDLPQVNHKDENRQNNRVENLEWCTSEYNNNYGSHNERSALNRGKRVDQFDLKGNFIKTWVSAHEVERQIGINHSNISACCRGETGYKTAGGFKWKYHQE